MRISILFEHLFTKILHHSFKTVSLPCYNISYSLTFKRKDSLQSSTTLNKDSEAEYVLC